MIPLHTARKYAGRVVEILTPHCERIEIAGSVRREMGVVNDIEVVCIPKRANDLLGAADGPCEGFIKAVERFQAVKGEATGKYTRRLLPNTGGAALDIFMVDGLNWGWQMALRTGSADFGRIVLLGGLRRVNHAAVEGYIYDFNADMLRPSLVPMREEADFFKLIGLPHMDPRERQGDYAALKKILAAHPLQRPCTDFANPTQE